MFPHIKSTSHDRFRSRIEKWNSKDIRIPNIRHAFWWFVHNAIAHRVIAFLPTKLFFKFHDFTSDRINGKHIENKPNKDHDFEIGEDLIYDYENSMYHMKNLKLIKALKPKMSKINKANTIRKELKKYFSKLYIKETFWNKNFAMKNNTIIDTILMTMEHKKLQPENMIDNPLDVTKFENYMLDFIYGRKYGNLDKFLVLSTNDLISLMEKK